MLQQANSSSQFGLEDKDDEDFEVEDNDVEEEAESEELTLPQIPLIFWIYEDDEEGFCYFFVGDNKVITTKLVVEENGVAVEWTSLPPIKSIVALVGIRQNDWEKKIASKSGKFFIQAPKKLETNKSLIARLDVDEKGEKKKESEDYKILKVPVKQENKAVF